MKICNISQFMYEVANIYQFILGAVLNETPREIDGATDLDLLDLID